VSTRAAQRTRSDQWRYTVAVTSGPCYSTVTSDPSSSTTLAPIPALLLRFGDRPSASFVLAQSAPAQRFLGAWPATAAPPVPQQVLPDPPLQPAAADAEQSPPSDARTEAVPDASPPGPEAIGVGMEESSRPPEPVRVDPIETLQAKEAIRATPVETPQAEQAEPAEPEEKPASSSHRIELIIDSLPHHELIEPIPVTIDALGDEMFTASMRDLEIAATGNSIGEALLFLKEQIESTFEDLNRRLSHLGVDQKTTLQMLHTYIPAQHAPATKSRWF
jgi:hypothetical protein